jgi:nitrogen regulatory protein PII
MTILKEIKAIILPFKRAIVIEALKQIEGLPGITVHEHVHGFGKSRGEGGHQKTTGDLLDYV